MMSSSDSHSKDSSIGVTTAPTMLKNVRSKPYKLASRPTLDEVLNNSTPAPYTLSAFIEYLSQKHCLETLNFVLEGKRYCESYKSLDKLARGSNVITTCSANIDLSLRYLLLLNTYILPGAASEVNLPVKIRDDLLQNHTTSIPPLPETLAPAVRNIRDLMEDSIFVSFLNSSSTYLSEDADAVLSVSAQNDSRYKTSDSQPTEPVQTKRSSLIFLRRPWSWPSWNRSAD